MTSLRVLVVMAMAAGMACGQGLPEPIEGSKQLVLRAQIASSISVTAQTNLTFQQPVPSNAMDPVYVGDAFSANEVENDPTHPGVAHIQVTANEWLAWSWDYGTALYNGSASLPTWFQLRYRGWWDPMYRNRGKYLWYYPGGSSSSGYAFTQWVPANRAQYDISGSSARKGDPVTDPIVDVWVRARVTRNGTLDPPGVYQQTYKQMGVTFSLF